MNNLSATDWNSVWLRHAGRENANEKVKTVPKLIKKIKQRQIGYIDLSKTNIKTVPEWIKSLPGITELDLSHTKITKLPEWIGSLTQLRFLNLSHTKITELPAGVGNLINLSELELKGTKLTNLPRSFTQLNNLHELVLSHSTIKTLPVSMRRLSSLRSLFIHSTKVTKLHRLPQSLKELFIDESLLRSFCEQMYGTNHQLKNLEISVNGTIKNFIEKQKLTYSATNSRYRFANYTKYVTLFRKDGKKGYKKLSKQKWNALMGISENLSYMRKQYRINNTTEFYNGSFLNARIKNVPPERRVFINKKSEVKNNGTVRRVYNKNGINSYLSKKNSGRLHGGNFNKDNVKPLKNGPQVTVMVNKSAYMKNVKNSLMNVSLNNFTKEVEAIKKNLPGNISRNDVNAIVKSMKKYIINKTFNRLKKSSPNDRNRLLNNFKKLGLINTSDVVMLRNKLIA
jgi:hypothetical protein